jgi:hypothetical protein
LKHEGHEAHEEKKKIARIAFVFVSFVFQAFHLHRRGAREASGLKPLPQRHRG